MFFFQITTDENMLFSNEKAINCFIIACSYVGSRGIFVGNRAATTQNYGAVINPAISLGIMFSTIFSDGFGGLKAMWIYPVMPIIGSLGAVFFYEIIYKKARAVIDESYNGNLSADSNSDEGGEHD